MCCAYAKLECEYHISWHVLAWQQLIRALLWHSTEGMSWQNQKVTTILCIKCVLTTPNQNNYHSNILFMLHIDYT